MHTITPPVDNVLSVKVSGKLSREEYADLVPAWENMIRKHGKFRLLFEMEPGFTGWEPMAAIDDVKFSMQHRNEIEKIAMVGEKKWHDLATKLGSLLVGAEVRYFDRSELDAATAWIHE
jgi:hypothetical protein